MSRKNYLVGLTITIIALAMVPSVHGQGYTQEYARGKLFLANGLNFEGKYLRMTVESVTVEQEPLSNLIGVALWGGISYGIGYLAGNMNDQGEIVYLNRA